MGGACFRKEQFADGERWVLYWMWLHPFARRRGILSRHWPHFQRQFGDFLLEPPLSSAMQFFVNKRRETVLA